MMPTLNALITCSNKYIRNASASLVEPSEQTDCMVHSNNTFIITIIILTKGVIIVIIISPISAANHAIKYKKLLL